MEENRARRVVDALRDRGINAYLAKEGTYQFGVRVMLPDRREAVWDSDGTAELEAQVMRDGMLVGFVPVIPGSAEFTEEQIIDAISRADYDQPIARERPVAPPPARLLLVKGAYSAGFSAVFASGRTPAGTDVRPLDDDLGRRAGVLLAEARGT